MHGKCHLNRIGCIFIHILEFANRNQQNITNPFRTCGEERCEKIIRYVNQPVFYCTTYECGKRNQFSFDFEIYMKHRIHCKRLLRMIQCKCISRIYSTYIMHYYVYGYCVLRDIGSRHPAFFHCLKTYAYI